MYRECWVTADGALPVVTVVLALIVLGLMCAIGRINAAARHWRECYKIAAQSAREYKIELEETKTQLLFPDRGRFHG